MKKWIYILIGLFIFLIITRNSAPKELRVRVIANSDSIIDQEIKYKVVESLIAVLNGINTKDEKIDKNIITNLNVIEDNIEKILDENGVLNQGYEVEMAMEKFPTKTLDNKVIPGGRYKTLVIRIGKASGRNWWSLLYPEFFECSYEDINSGEVEFRSYIWDKIKKIN